MTTCHIYVSPVSGIGKDSNAICVSAGQLLSFRVWYRERRQRPAVLVCLSLASVSGIGKDGDALLC